jgi:hypothetical protein
VFSLISKVLTWLISWQQIKFLVESENFSQKKKFLSEIQEYLYTVLFLESFKNISYFHWTFHERRHFSIKGKLLLKHAKTYNFRIKSDMCKWSCSEMSNIFFHKNCISMTYICAYIGHRNVCYTYIGHRNICYTYIGHRNNRKVCHTYIE